MRSTTKRKTLLPVYLKGLCTGKYTLTQASESTGYSRNWLCILKHKYLKEGLTVLDHKNRFRTPPNKTPETLRQKIAAIYAADFQDVNFQYFRACLAEFYDIKISIPTLTNILHDFGIKSPEARKVKRVKKSKRPRLRRQNEGDLIQIDGTPFPWLYKFGDETKYCLVGAIDDATGKLTGLYMTKNECLYGYLEIMRQTCKNYGVPREVYSDRAAIFCFTPRNGPALTRWEKLEVMHGKNTQWQRVLDELNVRQILAWSPEAKGRVERMWRTIQGQLPQWLYLKKIKTVEDANKHLQEYIRQFNISFSVPPAIDNSFWLEPPLNLEHILQCRISRQTDKVGSFSFHGYKFAVEYQYAAYKKFELCISERGIFAWIDSAYYPIRIIDPFIQRSLGDNFPQVLEDLIYRYLYAYAKEVSA